jgi:Protein of unknown function (DUF3253)
VSAPPAEAEATIRALLDAATLARRSAPRTRRARSPAREHDFHPLMPEVRGAARAMVARGELEVTQRGRVVDLDSAPDAIDVRFAPPPDAADWAPRRRLATVRAAPPGGYDPAGARM